MMESDGTSQPVGFEISESAFKNISNARRFAMDIGGSLTKIAYFSSYQSKRALFLEVIYPSYR
jgi:hypothetical protein